MKKIILLIIIFIHTFITKAQTTIDDPIILAYFPSWSENFASANQDSKLRRIPSFVNYVFLAFAKPDLRYTKDSFDILQTGIQVPYDGCTLKESISALKNKGIQVILSIGGETYWTSNTIYDEIEYQQIKDLVDDFGFAGIDWDFEPNGSFGNIGSPENVQHFIDFFNNSRAIMPKNQGYILACAPSGVGALGGQNNNDTTSPYAFENRNTLTGESDTELYNGPSQTNGINLFGFSATGHMIPVIESVGDKIDIIAYQGYNAGGSMNRAIMYDAFAYYAEQYDFKVVAGVHYPNEPWGPYYEYTHENIASLSNHIKTHPDRQGKKDGIMIWQLLLEGTNSSAYSYLNVASKVLNGSTESTAISEANSFSLAPYNGGADRCTTGGGDVYCGVTEYDNTSDYPTPNTSVYYSCKIWENQWYANANEIPGENSVWLEIENCTEDSTCTLSINEEELLENITIYVRNGFVYIEESSNKNTLKNVRVISISGQRLMNESIDNGRLEIDMRSLSNGFYILELDFGKYRVGKKISIN